MKNITALLTSFAAWMVSAIPFLGACPGVGCVGCGAACYTPAMSFFGLATSGIFASGVFLKLQPLFIALSAVLLTIGFFAIYRDKKFNNPEFRKMFPKLARRNKLTKVFYWVCVVISLSFIVYPLIYSGSQNDKELVSKLTKLEKPGPDVAFFNVDCLEYDTGKKSLTTYRPRVEYLAPQLDSVKNYALKHEIPMLITTCCSGRMPKKTELKREEAVFVSLKKTNDWLTDFNPAANYYIEKKAYGDPKMNYDKHATEMFLNNENIDYLLDTLNVENWIVFGNGFEACVVTAVNNLLERGYDVAIVEDLLISGAGGSPETKQKIIEHYRNNNVKIIKLSDLLKDY